MSFLERVKSRLLFGSPNAADVAICVEANILDDKIRDLSKRLSDLETNRHPE